MEGGGTAAKTGQVPVPVQPGLEQAKDVAPNARTESWNTTSDTVKSRAILTPNRRALLARTIAEMKGKYVQMPKESDSKYKRRIDWHARSAIKEAQSKTKVDSEDLRFMLAQSVGHHGVTHLHDT